MSWRGDFAFSYGQSLAVQYCQRRIAANHSNTARGAYLPFEACQVAQVSCKSSHRSRRSAPVAVGGCLGSLLRNSAHHVHCPQWRPMCFRRTLPWLARRRVGGFCAVSVFSRGCNQLVLLNMRHEVCCNIIEKEGWPNVDKMAGFVIDKLDL